MHEYLIGFTYHYPETLELWERGIIEDFEASTGVFIAAANLEEALEWASVVATRLLNHVNNTNNLTMHDFQHACWYEETPTSCSWSHCLEFFQHVDCGQMPFLDQMTAVAYAKWQDSSTKR